MNHITTSKADPASVPSRKERRKKTFAGHELSKRLLLRSLSFWQFVLEFVRWRHIRDRTEPEMINLRTRRGTKGEKRGRKRKEVVWWEGKGEKKNWANEITSKSYQRTISRELGRFPLFSSFVLQLRRYQSSCYTLHMCVYDQTIQNDVTHPMRLHMCSRVSCIVHICLATQVVINTSRLN